MRSALLVSAAVVTLLCIRDARADGVGNVTVQGVDVCSGIKGTFPLLVGILQTNAGPPTQTVYKLSILANISGLSQSQFIVDTLNQTGTANSGTATVFNNGFLGGGAGGNVFTGTWTGTFFIDNTATFNITSLKIVVGTAPNDCTLNFSNGQAVFAL